MLPVRQFSWRANTTASSPVPRSISMAASIAPDSKARYVERFSLSAVPIRPMRYPALFIALFLTAIGAPAAESAKSYQVTGPIIALTDTVITVQKDDEKWEIARSASTKVDGKLAVGSRVTIYYKMTADRVEVKEAAGKGTDKSTEKSSK